MAAAGRYMHARMLMVGDACGDLAAARSLGACFFPILPGREEASWQRLLGEGLDRFLGGSFAGSYQEVLVAELFAILPEKPPWQHIRA